MEVIISILICFLSVYGIFQLLYNFACYITKSNNFDPNLSHKAILVNNKTDNLEAYIRYLAMKEEDDHVIILNMADDEEMLKTIYILSSEFDFVEVMSCDEYIEYIRKEVSL